MTQPLLDTPLARHVDAHLAEISQEMISTIISTVPAYQRFPQHLISTDLTHIGEINLRLFLRTMRQDRALRPDELEDLIAVAIQRAKEGVPLEDVLRVYHVGAVAAWQMIADSVEDQRDELLAAVPYLLRYLGTVLPGVAAAYVREGQDLYWERREARRSLAEALLSGESAGAAARFDLPLAERYTIVALRFAEPPGGDTISGGRPSMRTVHAEIDRLPGALATVDRAGATVLIPEGADPDLVGLVSRIADGTGLRTTAGIAVAGTNDDIPAARDEAAEIASLAERLHRPSGVYRLADLAVEYQLARPGPARRWLEGVLEPLASRPYLLETLRAFLEHHQDRQDTASVLHVHRNTLNYRLGRIATLTAYNPNRPDDARILAAALTTHDLRFD